MRNESHDRSVLIIGAGIQGACTALELAKRGYEVTLLDRDRLPMNRTSLRNEGKIHLGLVYAADASMRTAKLQLEGALSFWPLLRRWVSADLDADALSVSTPFHYLVAADSLLRSDELEQHYLKLQTHYRASPARHAELDFDCDYLGEHPESLFGRLAQSELSRFYNTEIVRAGFSTAERSVSTEALAALLSTAVDRAPNITFKGRHHVKTIERTDKGFLVRGDTNRGDFEFAARQVLNAAWDGRLGLDAQITPVAPGWLYRLKYRVIVRLEQDLATLPSTTMVLGRYGDVVIRPDNTAYLSWYPAAIRGWCQELHPPETWQAACAGQVPQADFEEVSGKMIDAITAWYPALGSLQATAVDAGVIVAYGASDVDDPASGLHRRDRVGVSSADGYHSLDAGKLTTAPLFAMKAADRMTTA